MKKIARKPTTKKQPDAREWLRLHGYVEVANVIDGITEGWRHQGKKTRRDWWLVLAGTESGRACVIDGYAFPILRAARERHGFPSSADAVGDENEHAPDIRHNGRWRKLREAKLQAMPAPSTQAA